MSETEIEILSEDLNDFAEIFFVHRDFSQLEEADEEYCTYILSEIENVLVMLRDTEYDDDGTTYWFNNELCLRSLVVLTQTEHFSENLKKKQLLERTLMLLNRVLSDFNRKVLEDPEIVKAIEEGRFKEEISKRMADLDDGETDFSNIGFRSLVEMPEPEDLNEVPQNYEEIPDEF